MSDQSRHAVGGRLGADSSLRSRGRGVNGPSARTADELAADLFGRREELLRKLPHRVKPARNLDGEQRAMIVDDAATYVSVEHRKPISSYEEAEDVFFQRAYHLAMRAVDKRRRHSLVRGRFERVGFSLALDSVPAADADDPAQVAEAAVEVAIIREFIASLTDLERQVWRVKWSGATSSRHPGQGLGYARVADELGIPAARARKAERSITSKLDRFTVLLVAGRLCGERAPALDALAAGVADAAQSNLAHAHLEQCGACRVQFNAQLRATHSAAFGRKVAALIPPAPVADDRLRSQIAEWVSSFLTHSSDVTAATSSAAAQAAATGLGRGAGGILAVKIAAVLAAGAATIGATTGLVGGTNREPRQAVAPTPSAAPPPPAPTPTPTVAPNFAPAVDRALAEAQRQQRRSAARKRSARASVAPTNQEQTIISPAPAGSQPNGQSEFDLDAGANLPAAPPAQANTAPGAAEFGP